MSSKSPKSTTTTSTTEPPGYLQPYLKDAAEQARSNYLSGGPQYYPGYQTVGFSPQSQEALAAQEQRARQGSDVTRAAQDQNTATSRGDFLYGNPAFNAAVKSATDYTLPQVNSKFAAAGRTRSGLAQEAQARTISNAFANQYAAERENQLRAGTLAPGLAQQDYADIGALGQVGQATEQLAQDRLSEDVARYNYNQNLPEMNLANYVGMLNNTYPGQNAATNQPLYRNRAAGATGGALGGASLGGQYGGGWGALVGALAGGLLGGQ